MKERVEVKIDEVVLGVLRDYAQENGLTLDAAVESLLEEALQQDVSSRRAAAEERRRGGSKGA